MASYNYAIQNYETEKMARVVGRSLPVSTKQAIEISNRIRKKTLVRAKKILENVVAMKEAIPHKRFLDGVGHIPGIGPGRYPVKTCKAVLKLLDSVEANAQNKALNVNSLYICHIAAQKASKQWHYGRQRRRQMKRTNLEIVVREMPDKESKERKAKQKAGKTEKSESKALEEKQKLEAHQTKEAKK